MAGSLSDYAENALADHLMSKTAFTMPANVYAALCTVTITDSMTGATITEANYTGYARKEILATDLAAASGGLSTNSADITFANATAGSSTVIGVAIVDNSTTGAGNMLAYSDVTSHVIDASNTPATIPAGSLDVTFT
jgi:hypothetical protein